MGAATFASDAAFKLEINTSTLATDLLTSTGAIDLGTGVAALNAFDLGGAPLAGDETFTFIHADGGVNGTFAGLPNGAPLTIGGSQFTIHYTTTDVLLTIPEPGAMVSLLGGLGLLMGLRRRRA